MGHIHHHAIIVTSWSEVAIKRAHAKATKIFGEVSPLVKSRWNLYQSFFVPPDGSKEHWGPSFKGDRRREKFLRWLRRQCDVDGGSALRWVEIAYADDYGHPDEITSSNTWVDPAYLTPGGEIPF